MTDFFPELEASLYRRGLLHLQEELETMAAALHGSEEAGTAELANATACFRTLIRPRETLFRFSGARSILSDDPAATLEHLFDTYIDRQFARGKEYQETLMAAHLRRAFLRLELTRLYRSEFVGTNSYSVALPFVQRRGDHVLRAIKPLDLDKETSTKVYEHGDQWVTRVRRLRDLGQMPDEFLFAVRSAQAGSRQEAAGAIMRELCALDTTVVPFANEGAVLAFAQAGLAA